MISTYYPRYLINKIISKFYYFNLHNHVPVVTTHAGAGGYILIVSQKNISRYSSSCVASYMDLS